MCDPSTICGPRTLLKTVDYPWERVGADLIEGPQILHGLGNIFVVYSASGSWTADYIMGYMSISKLANPLIYENWHRHDQPVFSRNDEENVYGVGHASFTTSPGKQLFLCKSLVASNSFIANLLFKMEHKIGLYIMLWLSLMLGG